MTCTITLTFKNTVDRAQALANTQAIAMGITNDLLEAGQEVFGDACPTKVKVGKVVPGRVRK